MSEKIGWAWACIFNAFYELKDSVPKYYQLLGWSIDMRKKNNEPPYVHIGCMSENIDPLPLSRWFGTDTTNTTMEDMKDLFDKYDTFSISLTFRNNGVEIIESSVIELFRCDENGNRKTVDINDFNKCYKPLTGIFLKGKKNVSTADKDTENKQECNVAET